MRSKAIKIRKSGVCVPLTDNVVGNRCVVIDTT
jgi:hypothetical protein